MTQISPTALEEAWQAYQNTPIDLVADSDEETKRCVIAAITAYLAQREKEGFVEMPKEPTVAMRSAVAKFDWESKCDVDWADGYRAMLTAAQAWVPPFKIGDRVKHIGRNEYGTVISTDDGVVDVEFDIKTSRGAVSIGRFDERWFASHEGWLIAAASQEQNDASN